MKADELHQNLLNVLKGTVPQGSNLANMLADILCLGKEAIYRRLRGEVPFSFYEVATITEKLNVSLDNIIGTSIPNAAIFHIEKNDYLTPGSLDYNSFKQCIDGFSAITTEPKSKIGFSGNSLPHVFIMRYEQILKIQTFKWMYHQRSIDQILPYSKINISKELLDLHLKYGETQLHIKESYYTFDYQIFEYLVNDIQYFRSINYFSEEDVQKLKEELLSLLDELEQIAKHGKFSTGNKVKLYISSLNFACSYTYVESPSCFFTLIQLFILNGLISYNSQMFHDVKNLMKAQQRFSTLISETGEAQRVQFLKTQRELVGKL